MDNKEALGILKEMQLWRRAEGPYSDSNPDTFRGMPYTSEEFGEAIDVAISLLQQQVNTEEIVDHLLSKRKK